MHHTITMTLSVVGLLALTLLGRGLITGLTTDLDLDFSLRQSRAEPNSAQLQVTAERRHETAAPLCARP